MGTKMAVSFANIFMEKIETEILSKSVFKPTVWKRYIDDIFSLWEISKPDIEAFTSNKKIHITQLSNSRPISLTLETMFPTHGYIQRQQIQGTIGPCYDYTF